MADVLHSGTSITGGHTNAVAAGAAGFMSGTDKTNLDGLVSGTTQAIKKDGSVTFTADQPMGNFGFTGMRDGIAAAESMTYGEYSNPFNTFFYVDDFCGSPVATAAYGPGFVTSLTGGAVTNVTTGQDSTHIGVWQLSTQASATGRAAIVPPSNLFWTGGTVGTLIHEWLIKLPTLSTTGVQQYTFEIGLMDTPTGTQANAVYFRYDAAADTHWQTGTASGGSRTLTATTATVTAGAWVRLTITKAEGSAHYKFFIDKVDTGITSAANEPATAIYPMALILKSVGTTAVTALIDIFQMKQHFATERGA